MPRRSLPTVGDLVERLKALHAAHTLEAAPERSAPRRTATVEEAITTRIRQREQAETAPQPDDEPSPVVPATPCTAACHRTAAAGHACPGTPGTLARLPSSCACSRDGRAWLDRRVAPPHPPAGAVRIAALLSVAWLRHPAGAVAALAHRPGLPPTAREAARVGTRDRPACACPSAVAAPSFKGSQCNALGSCVKASALRCAPGGAAPQP